MKTEPDTQKLNAFMGKMLDDMGGAASGALVILGDRLGLFRAVVSAGPANAATIAQAAGDLDERSVHEWLSCMAASGYVDDATMVHEAYRRCRFPE